MSLIFATDIPYLLKTGLPFRLFSKRKKRTFLKLYRKARVALKVKRLTKKFFERLRPNSSHDEGK